MADVEGTEPKANNIGAYKSSYRVMLYCEQSSRQLETQHSANFENVEEFTLLVEIPTLDL